MPRLAVMTSGGDSPGMNAAIRAFTRAGLARGHEILGIRDGYTGLIGGDFHPLGARQVGGIINRGGTILGTTRCDALRTQRGLVAACKSIRDHHINGLVVIGGNGSQAGAEALGRHGVPVIGVASTIDNDLTGAEPSIGVMTALDVAVEAIDRIRTTAMAFRRAFLIEVMGRQSGYLALIAGIAGGAELIVLPEHELTPSDVLARLHTLHEQRRAHAIVVVAEGSAWNADRLDAYFKAQKSVEIFETRVTKLGHVQRGGAPGVYDRILATRLGVAAVDAFERGQMNVMLGMTGGAICATELCEVVRAKKPFPEHLLAMAKTLAQ